MVSLKQVDYEKLGRDARDPALFAVNRTLSGLERRVEDFIDCVDLLDHVDYLSAEDHRRVQNAGPDDKPEIIWGFMRDQRRYSAWSRAGAHEAVLAVHDLGSLLERLQDQFDKIDQATALLGDECLHGAKAALLRAFPHWVAMRHAVAHAADITGELDQHSYKGKMNSRLVKSVKGASVMLLDGFDGRRITMTRKGSIIYADLDRDNCEALKEIIKMVAEAIAPVTYGSRRARDRSL
ncbi:hypothetical protein [Sinorhizobium meliloti]|uniref:hypothetical protein n=1 Tax=Rhizobium meliloti TaxID=382 RepID=UPI003F14812C